MSKPEPVVGINFRKLRQYRSFYKADKNNTVALEAKTGISKALYWRA